MKLRLVDLIWLASKEWICDEQRSRVALGLCKRYVALQYKVFCGVSLLMKGYTTYFFEQAGLSTSVSFQLSIGSNGLTFITTALSWYLISYMGRRSIYIWGLVGMMCALFVMGFLSLAPDSNSGAKWATAAMVFVFYVFYAPTTGATCYTIVSEVSATRLRSRTVGLARNTYNLVEIVIGIITP